MRVAFALFLVLHGIAHLVGFLTPWGLIPTSTASSTTARVPTALFNGRVILGDSIARGFGVIWLIAGVAIVLAAIGLWRRESWALSAIIGWTAASLILCLAWWPAARIGFFVNVGV